MLTLWSLRTSPANGEHWVAERQCQPENGESWLAVFRRDEPGVTFRLSTTKPRLDRKRAKRGEG